MLKKTLSIFVLVALLSGIGFMFNLYTPDTCGASELSQIISAVGDWSTVEVVINLAAAGLWEEAATHEVLTITGDVELEISIACSTNCTSASADSMWWFLGESGATGYRMVSFLLEDADAGENLIPGVWSPGYIWSAAALTTNCGGIARITSHMGKDLGYQISDHAGTAGIITVFCRWRPLSTGGSVAAGVGVVL